MVATANGFFFSPNNNQCLFWETFFFQIKRNRSQYFDNILLQFSIFFIIFFRFSYFHFCSHLFLSRHIFYPLLFIFQFSKKSKRFSEHVQLLRMFPRLLFLLFDQPSSFSAVRKWWRRQSSRTAAVDAVSAGAVAEVAKGRL